MLFWNKFPFIRFLLFFISGIVLYPVFPSKVYGWLFGFASVFFLISMALFRFDKFRKFNYVPGTLIVLTIFFLGCLCRQVNTPPPIENDPLGSHGMVKAYVGTLLKTGQTSSGRLSMIVDIRRIRDSASWRSGHGKIILYLKSGEENTSLRYTIGDHLFIKGNPVRIMPPKNPGQFDFAVFMAYKGIFHQHFIMERDLVRVEEVKGINLLRISDQVRFFLSGLLEKHISDKDASALISALTLGEREKLDETLQEQYRQAGISHILAVSGLHVGIIYIILSFILKPLRRWKSGIWTSSLILCMILSLYALVTGLSPSVNRAVVMFIFVETGRRIGRRSVSINTLAASALFLLAANPNLIHTLGFQLSYLAVAGILLIQPGIYRMLSFDNFLLDWTWGLISVSLAAQLATFPLTIMYFHTFPLYFLIANLIAIPASFLLLVMGLGVMAFSSIPVLAFFIGHCAGLVTYGFNYSIQMISRLPYSLIENLYLGSFSVFLLYGLIFLVMLMIQNPGRYYLHAFFALLMILTLSGLVRSYKILNQEKLMIYHARPYPLFEFVKGSKGVILTDSVLLKNTKKTGQLFLPCCISEGHRAEMTNYSQPDFDGFHRQLPGLEIYSWNGLVLIYLHGNDFINGYDRHHPIRVDYIILGNNTSGQIRQVAEKFKAKLYISDASNSIKNSRTFIQECEQLKLNYHDISRNGALTIHLDK